jgi:glycosyltransferase involved in cell wall biosynthesis
VKDDFSTNTNETSSIVSSKKPLVSVIVTTYNRPHKLKTFIESMIAQEFQDWEVIIGDESVDGYGVVFTNYDPRVHWVKREQPINDWGQTSKETIALTLAEGEWFCFPNDDAEYHPQFLSQLLSAAERDGAGMAYCNCSLPNHPFLDTKPLECWIDVGGFIVRKDCLPPWADKGGRGDGKLVEAMVANGGVMSKVSEVLYVSRL